MHLLLYYECLCDYCIYRCVCLYTVGVLPISTYMDFLLVSNYSMVDVLVLHIQIVYYTCNILLLLTKQKQEFICDVNKMVILNK